jgi:5-methylcytosine-specific restriction endonuclease McrA
MVTVSYKSEHDRREYQKRYRELHREAILERDRQYHRDHRAQRIAGIRKYRAAHLEEERNRRAAYYAEHRDSILAYGVVYRIEHVDELREYEARRAGQKVKYNAEYLAGHRAEQTAREAARRALLARSSVGDMERVKAIYRRARENKRIKCYLCGIMIPLGDRHVDHVIPISKGGKHTSSNLAIACSDCNMRKHAKHPNEVGLLL